MTGLEAAVQRLLSGATPPGVYRSEEATPGRLHEPVRAAGWRLGHVAGAHSRDKAAVLAAIGEALDFPEWYGQNFDALADCLREVAGQDECGAVLIWDGWGDLAEADPRSFAVLLEVFGERAADAPPFAPPFAVLLAGDGPDVAVPRLEE